MASDATIVVPYLQFGSDRFGACHRSDPAFFVFDVVAAFATVFVANLSDPNLFVVLD
jgi:hypothetical protein